MTETPHETRTRFTMPVGEVAAAFGLPKSTLRNRMKSGMIMLSARRFGLNTSPFLYDPAEVEAEVPRYWAKVQDSDRSTPTVEFAGKNDLEFHVMRTVEGPIDIGVMPCNTTLRPATEIDQAEYCQNDALAGSEYCAQHIELGD